MPSPVRLTPLGGLGEIGMNCMVLEEDGRRVLIDCGVLFDNRGLGIEVIHADWEHLLDQKVDPEALILTHGHEDHLGGVSWFLRDFPKVPIYGPPYALALVRERLAQHPWHQGRKPDLRPLLRGDRQRIGPFDVEAWQVTHSMPECMGLVVRTGQGTIVHSGDFKIDHAPPPGDHFDGERIRAIGDEGVRLLLADSTNALASGRSAGEIGVEESLAELVAAAPHRVVIGLFASNALRMRSLFDAARACGRRVALFGRSVDTHVRIATELRLLPDPSDVLVSQRNASTVPRDKLLVLATGTQGEPRAALPRLANGSHPDLELGEGDRVILSSRIIPGNERPVIDLIDTLERRGIPVTTRLLDPRIHASGHAHTEELEELIDLVRPKAFLPVHGTFLHLRAHAGHASRRGVPNVLRALNGDVIELSDAGERIAERVWSGRIHVDQGGEPIDGRVIGERKGLAELGVLFVSVAVDGAGVAVSPPSVKGSGVFHPEDDLDLVRACEREAHREIADLVTPKIVADVDRIGDALRRAVRRVCQRELGKKPHVVAVVHRVNA